MSVKIVELKIYRYTLSPLEPNETDGTYGKGYVIVNRPASPAVPIAADMTAVIVNKRTSEQIYTATFQATLNPSDLTYRYSMDTGLFNGLELEEEYDYTLTLDAGEYGTDSKTVTIKKGKRFIVLDPDKNAIGLGTEPENKSCIEMPGYFNLSFGGLMFSPWTKSNLTTDYNELIMPGSYYIRRTGIDNAPPGITASPDVTEVFCFVCGTEGSETFMQIVMDPESQGIYLRQYLDGAYGQWMKINMSVAT